MPKGPPDSKLDVLSTLEAPGAVPPLNLAKAHLAKDPIQHDRQLLRARFSADGNFIIGTGLDKLIHVWEPATKRHYTLPGHDTWIADLLLNPKTGIAYTSDFQGNIRAWDWTKENSKPLFSVVADKMITRALAVTVDGKQLVSGGDDGIVRVWDATSGKQLSELTGHKGRIFSVACHPDGKHVLSGDQFGGVRQWEAATEKLVREFDAAVLHTRKEDFIADVGGVRCIAFNAEGSLMACGGLSAAESNTFCPGTPLVVVFDWATAKKKTELKLNFKSDGPVNALLFLKDGTLVGYPELVNAPTALAFWKLDKPEPFYKIVAESGYSLDLHPDGLRLLAPAFKSMGSGGNGARKQHKDKYASNAGQLLVFNLYDDPNPKGKKKA